MNNMNPIENENQRGTSKGIIIAAVVCLLIIGLGIYLSMNAYNKSIEENNARIISNAPKENIALSDAAESVPEIKPYNSKAYKEQANAGKKLTQSYYDSQAVASETIVEEEAEEVINQYTEPPTFMTPISGEMLNSYSNEALVFSSTLGDWRTHSGMDLKGESGDPVCAVADGTVKSFEYDEFYGNVLTLSHNDGYESLYCGLNDIVFFNEGDSVLQGEVIGTLLGDIPLESADECHLHLEILKDGESLDPAALIG